MATLLYRLGRWCFARRGLVVAIWLLLLALMGGAAAAFSGSTTAEFRMPGTESQRAMDALDTQFPQATGTSGTVVIAAPEGRQLTPEEVSPLVRQASEVPGVAAAMDPFQSQSVSPDGRYALIQVQFADKVADITAEQRTAFKEIAGKSGDLRVEVGGELVQETHLGGVGEAIGVLVAAIVLVITFGSLVAAGMTLVNALVGVGVGMAGLYALTDVVDLNDASPVLALMLGLAVGIDYSLFITSRYRQNLLEGLAPQEAAGRAIGTAGSAVVFAGATVVIALAGLSVVGIPFLTAMGLAAAATVLVAVIVALTLLPSVLAFAGVKVLPRKEREAALAGGSADSDARPATAKAAARTGNGEDTAENAETTAAEAASGSDGSSANGKEPFGYRWGRFVIRVRIPVLIAGVLALGALALPVTDMHLALPDAGTASEDTPQRKAYDLTSEGFGEGFNGRLIAVVSGADAETTRAAAERTTALIGGVEGVLAAAPAQFNAEGTTALVAVIPATGPTDPATEDTVHAIRDKVADVRGAEVALTGITAIGIDISATLADALPVYLLLVVGLSVLLLMLVFRSLLVPVKAAAGFLLTVGSTFGLTVLVFQQGHLAGLIGVDTPGPLVSFLPIILIGILFGLAMDYEVFLVSRMREDFVHGDSPRQATVNGLGHNARVVSAAALIMIAVFAGFMLTPDPIIKSIGFALAVGVFIDAFIVRMTLVPAVMALLGKAAWWLPRPVDRVLPNLDIEGESLRHALDAPAAREPEPAGAPR